MVDYQYSFITFCFNCIFIISVMLVREVELAPSIEAVKQGEDLLEESKDLTIEEINSKILDNWGPCP